MTDAPRLERLDDGSLAFDCPGCGMMHMVNVDKPERPRWTWNNDMVRPTFSPSVLVRWEFRDRKPNKVCHFFVVDGEVRFCGDCTHEHAGKVLPMLPIEGD